MPCGSDRGHGLQLWVNLKSGDKMVPPAYQVIFKFSLERFPRRRALARCATKPRPISVGRVICQ